MLDSNMTRYSVAALCLIISVVPFVYGSMLSVASAHLDRLAPLFASSFAGSLAGVLTCLGGARRTRAFGLVAIPFLLLLGCSSVLLKRGLDERTTQNDMVFCARARAAGTAPMARIDPRYAPRLDGDGRACEKSVDSPLSQGLE